MRKPIVKACLLDPDDGEGGIHEERSGTVLARGFASVAGAASHFRANREKYEAAGRKALAEFES